MSLWSPAQIAQFAVKAGFTSDDLGLAVGVSWAATQGDDAYQYNATTLPTTEVRGLWGLPFTCSCCDEHWTHAFDPQVSADMAYRKAKSLGGWMWHPTSGTTALTNAVDFVSKALWGGGKWPSTHAGSDIGQRFQQIAADARRIRDAAH